MAKRHGRRKKRRLRHLGLGLFGIAAAALTLVILLIGVTSCRRMLGTGGDALWDGSWYEDQLGRIGSDRALISGMEAFEKRTGVKPYLSLTDNVEPQELDAFAQAQYEALFARGDHLLVIYDEWGEDVYYLSAATGPDSALSEEDRERVLSYLEGAYADPANASYSDAFGAGFAQAAGELAPRKGRVGLALALLVIALFLLLCAIFSLFSRKKAWSRERDEEGYIPEEG